MQTPVLMSRLRAQLPLFRWLPVVAGLCLAFSSTWLWAQGAPPPTNYGVGDQPSARIAANPQLPATDPVALGTPEETALTSEATIHVGNILAVIRKGGLMMFPIMLCSVILLVFVLEREFFLRRARIMPRPFVRGIIEQLEQNQLDQEEAIDLCERNGSPISELFLTAMKRWGRPAVEVEQAVIDSSEHVTSQLRRYFRLFSAISNLAPLLGLLGTVLGMIDAFNSIAQADAMGRPEMLASGIGSALLTTAAGLFVAIPAYAAYAFFLAKADKLTLEMDGHVQSVIELVCAEAQGNSRSRRGRKAA